MFRNSLLSLEDMMSVYDGQTGSEFEFVQLAPGHLGYGQDSVSIGDVTISCERVDKPLRVRMRTPPDAVSVSFMLAAGGMAFWHGHEIETSHALVFGEAENEYILPAGLRSLNFIVPMSSYDKFSLPRPRPGLWRTAIAPRRLLTSVGCAALQGRHFAPDTDMLLLGAICDALAEEQDTQLFQGEQTGGSTRQFNVLQRAERMQMELAFTNIDDIAVGLGTSKRSLHRTFKGFAGLGPQSYLRILRLHQFRQRLVAAGAHDTITRLAYDHGFENMGRLSSQYRDWFGELPRQTRQRLQAR